MSELRQNLATKEWYVIATERAKRPSDFKQSRPPRDCEEYSEKCPFCPGNEHLTTQPVYQIDEGGKWVVKSVPNMFSAFSPKGSRERRSEGIYRVMNGVGLHEVIIESPRHNDFYTKMSVSHLEKIVRTYRDRLLAAFEDERIESAIIFKNYGESAGCSLSHPHSQMVATPVVPTHIRQRVEAAKLYCDDTGDCVFCVMMNEELKDKDRIVLENDSFVAFCPYASGAPFESWITPRRHTPCFGGINDKEMKDLASMMKDLFSRYYYGLDDPDFNFAVRTPPRDERNDRSLHWYIKVMPKLTKVAGFELGSGMFINVALPEQSAKFLREVKVQVEAGS
jgi:UDPglucose--hexose-1-phosphate uridylyltransferase